MYTTAARDVHYAALHPDPNLPLAGQLALNRQWLFLQANGPGELFQAYTKSLDYMVRWAMKSVQFAVLHYAASSSDPSLLFHWNPRDAGPFMLYASANVATEH